MRLRNVARDAPRLIHRENARQPGRNVCQGVNKQQTARPITAAIQRTHVHVWNAYLLLCWQFAIETFMTVPLWCEGRGTQTSRPSCSLNQQEAPASGRGSRSRMDAKMLHLSLTSFALGVPHPASFGAFSLCLCSRYVRCKSGSGKSYCEPKSNNCCNYLIHRLLLCVTGTHYPHSGRYP